MASSDRHQADLARSRDLLAAIFEASADAICLVNTETLAVEDCNQRAVEMFECADKGDLIGQGGWRFQVPEPETEERQARIARLETEGYWSDDLLLKTRRGREFWGNLAATPIRVAGRDFHLVRVTDISDRKQAEAALQAQKHLLEQILDALPLFIFLKDYREGRVTFRFLNRAAIEAFGLQGRDFSSVSYQELFGDQAEQYRRDDLEALQSDQPTAIETLFRAADGEMYQVILSRTPIAVGPAPGDRWLVACATDITERHRTKQELQVAKEKAEAAARAKSIFIANMHHELRSPLNAILGFADLLQRDANLNDQQRANLQIIHSSGEHLLKLVHQVLELARAEAGRLALDERDFDLIALLRDLRALFSLQMEAKGLDLHFTWEEVTHQYWYGDEVKLRQIAINLLSNAVKFTEVGGVAVQIRLHPLPDGDRHRLEFTVSDTGVGIAPEEIPHLFEAFSQTDSGRQFGQGTGLGLAISRYCARLLGGELELVESEVGRGSTFRCSALLRPSDLEALPERASQQRPRRLAAGQPNYRLLVADDNEVNRRFLVQLLAPLGFDVRAVANGAEAIARWQRWQPQAILLDIRMPGLDGLTVARRIRAREAAEGRERVALLALSATVGTDERAAALEAGCDDFYPKPLQVEVLFAALQTYLGVEYDYDREVERVADVAPLSPAQLTALSIAQRQALVEALVRCDPQRVEAAIAAIASDRPNLAAQLDRLANNLRYDTLLQLLEDLSPDTLP